jgi:hypothetical protein
VGIAREDYLQDPKEFERRRAREQIIEAIDNNDRNEAARIVALGVQQFRLQVVGRSKGA